MLLPLILLLAAPHPPAPTDPAPSQEPRPGRPAKPAPAEQPEGLPPQREPDTLPQEQGIYGTVRDPVADVIVEDKLVHEDRVGRAMHQLIDVVGEPGHGYAAVWRDLRDGHAGLYFGRLGIDGRAPEPERALYPRGSSAREVEPAIALSPRGNGAFVWYSSGVSAQSLKLRTFDADGTLSPAERLLPDRTDRTGLRNRPSAFGETAGDGRRAGGGLRLPAIAMTEEWGTLAWGDGGTVFAQRFDLSGTLLEEPQPISNPERPLTGPLKMCGGRSGDAGSAMVGCAWTTRDGIDFAVVGTDDLKRRSLGPGVLERLVASPTDSSAWWALVQTPTGHRMIPVPGQILEGGSADAAIDLGISAREACDVARHGDGFLISVQRANGQVELFTLDPREEGARPKVLGNLDLDGSLAGDVRVAGSGSHAVVAWSASKDHQRDVQFRTLDGAGTFGPAARWNTDEASSLQNNGRIASRGGDLLAVAWLDGRSGDSQLMARWIGADGSFKSGEIHITERAGRAGDKPAPLAGEPTDPAIAMAADGGFLVAWKQLEKRGYRMLGQCFDARGEPQSELLEFDSGEDAPPVFQADIDATPFGRGYAVAYGRKDRGVFVRTVQAGGRAVGEPVLAGEHPLCQNTSLVELDGGNLAVAWDITVPGHPNKAVRARVLDARLEPRSQLIEPPLTLFGDDWDPALAPVEGGGFAIAFTGGQAHSRDVFLRFFDARGKLASPLVPISTRMNEQDWPSIVRLSDGTLCVGIECDLSAYDHCYVRRVTRGGPGEPPAILGPIMTLNQRETRLNENRGSPRLAPLAGGGFAAVWIDCRRSQSTDVRLKILGPGFDAEKR